MMNLLKIRDLCKKESISIRSLAQHIGMSEQNFHRCIKINKIEAGALFTIAQFFNVPIGYFFNENIDTDTVRGIKSTDDELKKEIELLTELINEKERTIQILMNKK